MPQRPLFIVIYGLPGMGKTSITHTAEKPVLLFDFDKGLHRASKKLKPDALLPGNYKEISDYITGKEFENDIAANGYKTTVLDTIGTLLDDFLSPHLVAINPKNGNGAGGLGLTGWGVMQGTFNALKARIQSLGQNVVAVCHAKEEGDDVKQLRLDVKGGSRGIIERSADMIGLMYVKGGKRYIDFSPTEWHIGKDIIGIGEIEVPHTSSPAFDTFLSDLIQRCQNEMQRQSQAQIDFIASLQEWRDVLEPCRTPDDFNGFIKSLSTLDQGLLKNQVKVYLGEALKANGCYYDVEAATVKVVESEGETKKKKGQ